MAEERNTAPLPAPTMEYKALPLEMKATGDQGEYEGHFAIKNNEDDGGDVLHDGSFHKTIAERGSRVKVFYAHDWTRLLGPTPHTLKEDSLGLYAAGRLTLDTTDGANTWALLKDNALNEGSIGYSAVKYDYEERPNKTDMWQPPIRHLREVKLFEISFVPLGMNPLTSVQSVKAALMQMAGHASTEPFEQYLRTLTAVAEELKTGRVLSAANKEKVESAIGALQSALDALNGLISSAAAEPEKGALRAPTSHSTLLRRLRAVELALAPVRAG